MKTSDLTHRLATEQDIPVLRTLMELSIRELQKPFLDSDQIISSMTIMGLDSQLIRDGTYFIVFRDNEMAGCGGWSRRNTLYGGDQTPDRSSLLLDPTADPARVRAMYTHPDHTRQGVGTLILQLCEDAARLEGFKHAELMSTLSGEPLYRSNGYKEVERILDDRGGKPVPLIRMRKPL